VGQLKARVLPAVVAITTPRVGSGSGVVVSEDGYIMTAAHCLDKPGQEITVRFCNGTSAKAKVLGFCPALDAGLIKIVEEGKKWPFVKMGRSHSLRPGAWCVAIGYPGKYSGSVTPVTRIARIIEATDYRLLFTGPMAACDSGGPIFDLDGRVVGVMQGMNIGTDRGIAVDVFTKNWQRLTHGEVWQLVATEEDDF
jgi:S1-C subfamily serine protease